MSHSPGLLGLGMFVGLFVGLAACGETSVSTEERIDPAQEVQGGARPNVLLISIDSLRADHLHCYGYERETSPRIDALAAQGARFTDGVSSTSWTLPSHATMFTGLPLSVHGADQSHLLLAPERRTVAEVLAEVGYHTVGLWSGPYLHPIFGLSQGFDEWVNCASYDFFEGDGPESSQEREREQVSANRRSHEDITGPMLLKEAEARLRGNLEKPFFLFVHMWDVHYDYIPPPPFDQKFDPRYRGDVDGTNCQDIKRRMPRRDLQHLVALYDGEIAWTDLHVGKILDLLEEFGLDETTLVILTSDHGEEFFEHGKFGHRKALFEESIAVPLVMRYPGVIDPGQTISSVVSLADIAPTILEAAGAPALPDLAGISLLAKGSQREGSVVLSELRRPRLGDTLLALRAADWKLILVRETEELIGYWDLDEDPAEKRNLVGDGALRPGPSDRMRDSLRALEELESLHALTETSELEALPEGLEESLRDLGYIGGDE